MKNAIAFLAMVTMLFACSSNQKTDSGYQFEYVQDAAGDEAQPGDVVNIGLKTLTMDGVLIYDAYASQGVPISMLLSDEGTTNPDQSIQALMEVLPFASEGDVIRLTLPTSLVQNLPPEFAAATSVNYEIEILKVQSVQEFAQAQAKAQTQTAKQPDYVQVIADTLRSFQRQYATGQLDGMITRTASGLGYLITDPGEAGTAAKAGEQVKVLYHGVLASNGQTFDDAFAKGQTFDFEIGGEQAIKAWDEAFAILDKGATAFLFVPPGLAYGAQGYGNIPPNAELIFYVLNTK